MNKERGYLQITKPIMVFCIILILLILVSCSKNTKDQISLNVNKNTTQQKTLVDNSFNKENNISEDKRDCFNKKDEINKYFENENREEDLSNIRNTYYGKYNFDGEDIFGNFEVTRNSIIFTPDNGNSKEIIHFSGIKNIDRVEYPNGKVDLLFQYDGYEKLVKNVSDEMFSDVLLYTTK